MAREYGHVFSAIWNDPDFRRLPAAAQRVYLMLITQADISSAGTLPLTVRRWSGYAADTTSDALSDALSTLEKCRFLVIDTNSEELLVRKFVKWDGGWTNEKRRRAIAAAAGAVASAKIRTVLAAELDKLGVDHPIQDAPSDIASDSPCQVTSDAPRVVVTEVSTDPNPQPEPTTTSEDRPAPRDDVERLCQHLADRIEANGSKRRAITAKWRDACRLMLDRDGRTEQQIRNAIDWCQSDEFWRTNILSMPKLREKYDQLRLAAQRPKNGKPHAVDTSRLPSHQPLTVRMAQLEAGIAAETAHVLRAVGDV